MQKKKFVVLKLTSPCLVKHKLLEPLPCALGGEFWSHIQVEAGRLWVPRVRLSRVEIDDVGNLLATPIYNPIVAVEGQSVAHP